MFKKLTDAQRAVSAAPWLRSGTLVDWRRIKQKQQASTSVIIDKVLCKNCKELYLTTEVLTNTPSDEVYCQSCFMASSSWSDTEKKRGVGFVVEMLEMLAENDDFFVNEASLRKQIIHRWPDE
eukprot:15108538-Ditylum_brightwellii.AAC.1